MDYSSLILMERDNETGFVTKELGSYKVSEGAEHIKGFYVKGDNVYIKFDTNKDVEEWEYSAIYDVFDMNLFENEGFKIEEVEDEYNPTFLINFEYKDGYYSIKDDGNGKETSGNSGCRADAVQYRCDREYKKSR